MGQIGSISRSVIRITLPETSDFQAEYWGNIQLSEYDCLLEMITRTCVGYFFAVSRTDFGSGVTVTNFLIGIQYGK